MNKSPLSAQFESVLIIDQHIVPSLVRQEEPTLSKASLKTDPFFPVYRPRHYFGWLLIAIVVLLHTLLLAALMHHWHSQVVVDQTERVYRVALITTPPPKSSAQSAKPKVSEKTQTQASQQASHAKASATPSTLPKIPSKANDATLPSKPLTAQQLLHEVRNVARTQGWQQTAERYAQLTPAKRNAISQYIADWTRDVQIFSDQFIQMRPGMDGRLRIGVTVNRQGQLIDVHIVNSSGNAELDQLALRTTRAAAPFAPFSPAIGNEDQLSFTRVWLFGNGIYFTLE